MTKIKELLTKNAKIFINNFSSRPFYSCFIIIMSSLVTYLFLNPLIGQKVKHFSSVTQETNKSIFPQGTEELYVERGSPYDERAVGTATEAAQVIFHGPRDKKNIALTFDAEMTDKMRSNLLSKRVKSSYNKRIIDILNQENTKATLFLTGMWIELYPDVTTELSRNPLFELGSHSYSDTSFHGFCYGLYQIPKTLAIEEIGSAEKLLREYAGIDNRLFRFPGGCYTPQDVALVHQTGDTVVHWDVRGSDGFNNNTAQIEKNVIDNTQNGSIIILHMNGAPTAPKTAEALPKIISTLKTKGFSFVTVSELLGLPPAPKARNF